MSISDDPKLKRYLEGFSKYDDVQEPPGRDGDPQLAALSQFLQTLVDKLGPDDVILDVGSGRGILAYFMNQIWNDTSRLPWYYAVDLEEPLNQLNLPYHIHNHSQKILFTDFLDLRLTCQPQDVKIVVIRNTFHELNIKITAEVLITLRRIIRLGAQVYLQDMVSLPKGERENAGWHPDLLQQVLEKLGFNCGAPTIQSSYSGTKWFTMILKEKDGFPIPNLSDTVNFIAKGRKKQIEVSTVRLATMPNGNETVTEYIMLMAEVAALSTQLQQVQYNSTEAKLETMEVAELPLTKISFSSQDYAEEMQTNVRKLSGLIAILSSKNLIDLPVLLDRAVSRLWFAGYSQRLLFTLPAVRDSLKKAASRGVDIRILLVDPESPAGQARSVSEAYTKPEDFFSDVITTVQHFSVFKEEVEDTPDLNNQIQCELHLCKSQLSSSFFFVDDLCISSLYSANLTGGAGCAFVFKSSSVQKNGYFQVLLREFQSAWI